MCVLLAWFEMGRDTLMTEVVLRNKGIQPSQAQIEEAEGYSYLNNNFFFLLRS